MKLATYIVFFQEAAHGEGQDVWIQSCCGAVSLDVEGNSSDVRRFQGKFNGQAEQIFDLLAGKSM